jgi:BirA family biotin operon repressor/biotin-[acetyl-CoA-carboxylase] ligase
MVYKMTEISTRGKIISILRNNSEAVSGEKIAGELGLSRVAVWKGIQSLNGNGYRISSSPLGYRLEGDLSGSLYPWEFGGDEGRFKHWDTTDSTMLRAREAALSDGADGLVLIAEAQIDGRGTGKKKWESAAGGLFFTLLTRPVLNSAFFYRQVIRAQYALIRSLRALGVNNAFLLWPNDIYTPEGKAGGILCETLSTGNTVAFSNLGVGINTGIKPDIPGTASLKVNRKDLLRQFLSEFEKINGDDDGLISAWNEACPLTGRTVNFRQSQGDRISSGTFCGIDRSGWAVIETDRIQGTETGTGMHLTNHYPPGSVTLLDKGHEQ